MSKECAVHLQVGRKGTENSGLNLKYKPPRVQILPPGGTVYVMLKLDEYLAEYLAPYHAVIERKREIFHQVVFGIKKIRTADRYF